MSREPRTQSRDKVLANIWIKEGMPERLIIHVGTETIRLVDGMPENASQDGHSRSQDDPGREQDENRCATIKNKICRVCGAKFKATHGRTKICSDKCRKTATSENARKAKEKHAEEIMETAFGKIKRLDIGADR